jgi:hypothetical protein
VALPSIPSSGQNFLNTSRSNLLGATSVPRGIGVAASTLSSAANPAANDAPKKGLAVRCWDWGFEGVSIVFDFVAMILHLCTFNLFKSSEPKSKVLEDDGSISPAFMMGFYKKKETLIPPNIKDADFEQAFFKLYHEYSQPKLRDILLNDYMVYTLQRALLDCSSDISKVGFSPEGESLFNGLMFKHKLDRNQAPAKQLKAFAGTPEFEPALIQLTAQMIMLKNMNLEMPLHATKLKEMIGVFCETVAPSR